MELGTKSI